METDEKHIENLIVDLLSEMRDLKSNDRTEKDRRIAIALTEGEKLLAWWVQFVETV